MSETKLIYKEFNMPRFDGTGPEGKGELTGRGMGASVDGVCEGRKAGLSENQVFYNRGRQMRNEEVTTTVQRGRGMGPCGLGLRRGLSNGLGRGQGLGLGRGRRAGMGRRAVGPISGRGMGMGRNRGWN
jgi:hypothetical protein